MPIKAKSRASIHLTHEEFYCLKAGKVFVASNVVIFGHEKDSFFSSFFKEEQRRRGGRNDDARGRKKQDERVLFLGGGRECVCMSLVVFPSLCINVCVYTRVFKTNVRK